jgi:hypothetical protein
VHFFRFSLTFEVELRAAVVKASAMRLVPPMLVITVSFSLGCGGGTPPPKTEETAATSADGGPSEDSSASPEPAASEAPAATPPAPAASSEAAGDIKPPSGDDPWMASHQMPPGDVLKTMKPKQAKVQACFKTAKKKDPSVSGEVKVRFVITNAGKIRDWKDDASSITDPAVTKCVGEIISKMKFPKQKSPGDAWGAYTVNFPH